MQDKDKDLTLDLELVVKLLSQFNVKIVSQKHPEFSPAFLQRLASATALLLTAVGLLEAKLATAEEETKKAQEWAGLEMQRADKRESDLLEAQKEIAALKARLETYAIEYNEPSSSSSSKE
jgi:hypothetical protein